MYGKTVNNTCLLFAIPVVCLCLLMTPSANHTSGLSKQLKQSVHIISHFSHCNQQKCIDIAPDSALHENKSMVPGVKHLMLLR